MRLANDNFQHIFPHSKIDLDAKKLYHYEWVKEPEAMQRKQENFHKLWHDDHWIEDNVAVADKFDYSSDLKELKRFNDSHPEVMKERIVAKNWEFSYDTSFGRRPLKYKLKALLNNYFGIDLDYKNYKIEKERSQRK